jgi:hypothetical protein
MKGQSMKASHLTIIIIIAAVCTPVLLTVFLDALAARNSHGHFKTTTEFSLDSCKSEIQRYTIKHNALPNYAIKDCWGNPIRYSVDSNGMVTLSSYGKDNKPGGTESDTDYVGVYPSRQSDGRWSDESVQWTQEPGDSIKGAPFQSSTVKE